MWERGLVLVGTADSLDTLLLKIGVMYSIPVGAMH